MSEQVLFEREWDETATEWLLCAEPDEHYRLALVIKRTYAIAPDGQCTFAEEQEPLEPGFPRYEELEPPQLSPTRWDSDLIAFKQATDVVIQGHAYAYGKRATVDAELSFGSTSRTVRVHGERRCELHNNRPVFTPAEPFEQMPIRYDRAYGGFDATALEREGDLVAEAIGPIEPDWGLGTSTRFHYPRNRTGAGYLIEATPEALESFVVPNLEFPFDPVTPERLAIGESRRWLSGPLPASFDWSDPGSFPRIAYLGEVPEYVADPETFSEVAQGWAPRDLLRLPSIAQLGRHPGFLQGASPGLAVGEVAPDETFLLRNLFPDRRERRVELPGWRPTVKIRLTATDHRETETRLNAVVIQPDHERVILVWSARCEVNRPYMPQELGDMAWDIT